MYLLSAFAFLPKATPRYGKTDHTSFEITAHNPREIIQSARKIDALYEISQTQKR